MKIRKISVLNILFRHEVILIVFHVSKTSHQSFFSSSGEEDLQKLIDGNQSWNVGDIKDGVTAKDLCSCRDPIMMAFKVITTTTIRSLSND